MADQHCFEHYGPQFRMGPTIKIAKHMLNKARDFTMPGVDLLFQVNMKLPNFLKFRTQKIPYICMKIPEYTPHPLNTLGPPAAHHLKDVSMAGRWWSDLVCLLHTVRGGIGPFTFVRFRSLLLIKSEINRDRSGRYETIIFVKLMQFYVRYLYTLSSFIFLFHIICQNRLKTSQFPN